MNKQKEFSYTKGFSFLFEEGGSEIEAWFSAFSGLEKVFVNGELVSSQRNRSKNSTQIFKIGENEYSTNTQVNSVYKGPIVCTLNKNGEAHKRLKLVYPTARTYFFSIGIGIAFGGVFGVAVTTWDSAKGSLYVILVAFFVALLLYRFFFSFQKPIIEEEIIK